MGECGSERIEASPKAPLVLLTDFGLEGPYVGQMKGVLAVRAPGHPVIDLTHSVSPQDVREGAFLLEVSWLYFPAGSVFVAVVDPGVGTDRLPVAIAAQGRFFVGPDNGLLTGALPPESVSGGSAVRLDNAAFRLPDMSATFHGRDVFAPAGAALATGTAPEDLGASLSPDSLVPLARRDPVVSERSIEGRIVHVDRFGNLVSDVSRSLWKRTVPADSDLRLRIADWNGTELHRTYADVPPGEPLALFGSLGYLEIGVNGGSAAHRLGVGCGEPVTIRF